MNLLKISRFPDFIQYLHDFSQCFPDFSQQIFLRFASANVFSLKVGTVCKDKKYLKNRQHLFTKSFLGDDYLGI